MSKKNEKLIAERLAKYWTQEDACAALDVPNVRTWQRWESNDAVPTLYFRKRLSEAFGKSIEELGFFAQTTSKEIFIPQTNMVTGDHASVDMFSVGMIALVLAQQDKHWSLEELQAKMQVEIRRLTDMEKEMSGMPRRNVLSFLAGLPLAVLGLSSSTKMSLSPEEILPLYVTSVPAAWKLYFDGHIGEVAAVLPEYISHLTALTQQSTRYHETAVSLLSQAHQLGSLVVLENEDFGASMAHNKKALSYSQSINNPDIQLAAYIRQANTLYYRQRWTQMLQTYEEALQTVDIKQASPLVQGRIYSGYGASLCKFEGNEQDARRYMSMAHEIFPDQPENDLSYVYMNATHYVLHLNDMITLLDIKDARNAKEALKQASLHVPNLASPRGIELLNHKAMVASALGDLEETYQHLEQSITFSRSLGSDLYIGSAKDIIDALPTQWQKEKQVKQLVEKLG